VPVLSIKSAKISYFAAEMKHVNPSFSVQAANIDFANAQLFVEVGPTGFSLVVLEGENNFKALVSYTFAAGLPQADLVERLNEIFHSETLLKQQYNKTNIFWTFTENILVPVELMNADRNKNILNLVFGDATQGMLRSDFIYKHNLHNVYRIPQTVIDVFSTHLPLATQTHLYSTMVNKDFAEGNHLFTVVYSNSITAMLCKDGRLQVIQTFAYNSPDDCAFHLLNMCKGFDVLPDTVHLHLNGMIEAKSGLFDAIYRYFLRVEFDTLPDGFVYDEKMNEYPPHFFSHLFGLALCV
jgi:hypothetical protein